jgi:hypothetical protein
MISKKMLGRAVAAAASLLVVVGCNGSFGGHGHMASSTGHGSAALTFRVLCPVGSDTISGSIEYLDRAAGVQMSGAATGVASDGGGPITCDGDQSEGHYVGGYTSRYGSAGSFAMDLVATSPECRGRALVTIAATSGVHAGYTNTSCLQGKVRPLGHAPASVPGPPCVPFPLCVIEP